MFGAAVAEALVHQSIAVSGKGCALFDYIGVETNCCQITSLQLSSAAHDGSLLISRPDCERIQLLLTC